ncbi:hypothetical protein F511_14878 [Dorcoceras hygrometricum]|uniref:Retrotransposon gag domain-containing protein n=1 Tax=Dorcoceras hygrometricum TaxID=472368 RepID=A0A2Z7BS75_9LAMI|nr:hypothetical protein F511_14878 [Dorcoceras hygrometricum]
MNPQTFDGDESSSDAESWLQHITGLFDRVRYDDERRLSLTTFQLRKNVERWWIGASRTLEETDTGITWNSYCTAFRQEYVPESYVNDREREFDNMVQGTMSVGEYARRFSSLLAYVPHVSGRERAKRNRFLEGLNEDLYSLVLASSPTNYADAVTKQWTSRKGCGTAGLEFSLKQHKVHIPMFQGRNLPNFPSHPSSRNSQCNNLDATGLGHVAISSRRSRVLVLLVQEVRVVAVVLGLSSVVSVEANTLRRSLWGFTVLAKFVGNMDILREYVHWLDLSTPLPHHRVVLVDHLEVVISLLAAEGGGSSA